MELHVLYPNATPKPQGHPQCLEPEDLVTTALDDFVSGDYLEVSRVTCSFDNPPSLSISYGAVRSAECIKYIIQPSVIKYIITTP